VEFSRIFILCSGQIFLGFHFLKKQTFTSPNEIKFDQKKFMLDHRKLALLKMAL